MPDTLNPSEPVFIDYWQVILRRRWILISFFTVCVTTVTLGSYLITPLYRATTRLVIEGENTNVLSAEETPASGMNFDIYENYLETQMALIKSDSIAGKVYEEFHLGDSPRYKKREGLLAILNRKFEKDIYLKRLPGTRMIELSVENPDAKISADLANRLAEVYSQDNLKRRALTFIRNQRMGSLNAEFLKLQSRYDSLSNQLGPKHPEMIALRDEIRSMARRIESEKEGSSDAPGGLMAEDKTLLEDTLLKIQESSVISSSRMQNIGIVDRATVPDKIAKPKRVLNIILGFIMGLFGGLLLIFFVDYMDDTLMTEDDVKKATNGTTFLGSLPSEKRFTAALGKGNKIEKLVFSKPDSAFAEAYRLIRTRVLWSIDKNKKIHDIAVLSSMPGEGKTTIASNLAISLAQLNHKILLVDCDLRRGRMHAIYGISNELGLGQYLTDDPALDKVIQKTEVPNLSVVASGTSVIDSSQLFSSSRMHDFIKHAREKFDYVIYDTPPISVIADTAILVPHFDAVILTVRGEYTKKKIVASALSTITESKANLIGVIMNDSKSMEERSYSRYYHAYQKS